MEELLNKLIEKGWKPMWNRPITQLKKNVKVERYNKKIVAVVIKNGRWYADDYYSLRDIISKESWLWQFVCENGMIKKDRFTWMISPDPLWEDQYNYTDYRYRLIESALKDESELESFILDNIKV